MTIKNGKLLLLMILVAGSMTIPVFAQNWYQDVYDQCENFTNVAGFSEGMIANGTFWGFNNSVQGDPILEDSGDFTEVDPDGVITIHSATSVQISSDLDEADYLYRDLGVDEITDFSVSFEVDTVSSILNGRNYAFMVSKTLGAGQVNGDLIGYRVRYSTGDAKYQYAMVLRESAINNVSTYLVPSGSPTVWVTMVKKGALVYTEIYSNSARTTLLVNLTDSLGSDESYRYLYYCSSDDVSLGGRNMNIIVDDLKGFSFGGLTTGVIYSVGIPDTTQPMILSTQIKLDTGNRMFVQFSNDNSSWVNEQNFVGSFVEIYTGWKAFNLEKMNWDIVYFRFNFSRPGGAGDCDLRQWRLFYRDTPNDKVNVLAGDWDTYNVSEITVEVGTYVHGNLTSLFAVDNKTVLVNEVVGIPGFDIRFNFTSVPKNSTSLSLRSYCEYDGNPAHIVKYQGWHFDSKTWVDLIVIPEHGFSWHNESLSLGGYIENVTGKVWIKLIHVSSGSIGHYINVDYLRLRAFVPTGGVDPNLDAWSINWLLSLIWMALVAIGIFDKNKIVIMFAGFFGIILALLMMTENMMVAIALICLNLYLLYEGTE